MSDNEMCNEPYTRPPELFPVDGLSVPIRCTFLTEHGANHSWYALEVADSVALDNLRAQKDAVEASALPAFVQDLVRSVNVGNYDPYLEVLLSVLHDRKRALRNVAGFPRRTA